MSVDVSSPPDSPAVIDAVPLRHPWRWVAAIVIVVLVALFLYGAATNDAYGWGTFGKYLFDERIVSGVWSHPPADRLVDGPGDRAGGVLLAVMRLSPNPVFRSVSWVYPVDLPRHPGLRAVGVLGPGPDDLQEHPAGHSVRADVLHTSTCRTCRCTVPFGGHRPGAQRGRLHGRDHPGGHQFGAGRSVGGLDGAGHVVGDGHAAHGATAGDAGHHPADRQRVHQHAEDHLAGDRGAVHIRSLRAPTRHLRGDLPADPAAAGRGRVVPAHHQHPDGRASSTWSGTSPVVRPAS